MSDMRYMYRENKKRQLRNNIVQLPKPEQNWQENDEDSEEIVRQVHNKRRNRRFLIFAVTALFLAALGYCWYRYQQEYQYTEYTVNWEKSMRYADGSGTSGEDGETAVSESSFVNFELFGDNMIKYTKDGASYIDASGKTVWTQGYEMKTPIISINGSCAAIADQQGNDIYIFNKEGTTGIAKTQLPISKVAVSGHGVTAAIVEDSTAAYVMYYKKDGSDLQISIKMLLQGDGYPVDLALSPDGRQIVMSVMYLENGVMKNKVVFYDFSEIGKNVDNRFIGGFEDEFEDKMAARVRYLNDETVCVFTDKGISFISVKNVIPDPEIVTVNVEEEIESICYSDRYAGVIVDSTSGNPYRLDIYRTDGTKAGSAEFDYSYSGVKIDGDLVILYNDESCMAFNVSGDKKFEGQFDFPVACVRKGKNRMTSLIVAGSEVMKEIKLK